MTTDAELKKAIKQMTKDSKKPKKSSRKKE